MHRACLAAALAAAIAIARPAHAGVSLADRDAARTLAGKGYEAFEAGQYQRAIELFQQAEARFHAPPHLLYVGRAQVKLGKLIEAEATFRRILDEKLGPDAPAPFKEAQASAKSDLAEVDVLVPRLVITIEGREPAGVRYFVDGQPLDAGSIGKPIRYNPGSHLISAEPPGQLAVERTVVLKLGGGEEARVALTFAGHERGSVVPGAVTLAFGVAGLGVGVAGAVLASRAQNPNKLRIMEITGFAVGGAAVVTGSVLLAVRPGGARSASARPTVQVGLGLGVVEVTGRF